MPLPTRRQLLGGMGATRMENARNERNCPGAVSSRNAAGVRGWQRRRDGVDAGKGGREDKQDAAHGGVSLS